MSEPSVSAKSQSLDQKDRLALLFREAVERGTPGMVLVFEGNGIAGILRSVQGLSRLLDPRHFVMHHFSDENARSAAPGRPLLHEYWQRLPQFGELAVFDGAYYHDCVVRDPGRKERAADIEEIRAFERTLSENGYLVLKLRIERKKAGDLKKDLKNDGVCKSRRSPLKRRRRDALRDFDYRAKALARLVKKTDTPAAPWFTPPAGDSKSVRGAVFDYLIARLEERLGIDSRVAVAEFDERMASLRRLREMRAQSESVEPTATSTTGTETNLTSEAGQHE